MLRSWSININIESIHYVEETAFSHRKLIKNNFHIIFVLLDFRRSSRDNRLWSNSREKVQVQEKSFARAH